MTARCYCNHDMVETNRHYEIIEGRPELQVELTCTNPECGNVWIRRFPSRRRPAPLEGTGCLLV